ncbi:MAG: hypothetical protein R2715_08065, partial [Ilumatobacteraceae bacterium]
MLVAASCGSDDNAASDTTAATTTAAAAETTTTAMAESSEATTEAMTETSEAAVTTEAAAGDDVDALVTALLERNLDFNRPTTPVDPGSHEVAVVAAGLASSGPTTVANELAKAFAVMGWTAPDA